MNRSIGECIAAAVVLIASTAGLVESWGYRGESAIMPLAVTGLAITLSALWLGTAAATALRGASHNVVVKRVEIMRLGITAIAAVAYAALMSLVGFFTATLLVVPLLTLSVGYRNVPVLAASTIGFVIVLYAVFRGLLSVPLPNDLLLSVIGGW